MTNDNNGKPTLRVVDSNTDEKKRRLIAYLRTAIDEVEGSEITGLTIALIRSDGSVMTIASDSVERHMMVAATVYQLFDLALEGISYQPTR